jgi:vancomycin resistance protein VanJ
VRVLTANLLWKNDDSSDVAATILREAPDVVTLQELAPEMAAGLTRRLRERYPYQETSSGAPDTQFGIYSRYPILASRPVETQRGGCFCQEVSISLPAGTMRLFNIHLENPEYSFRALGRLAIPRGFTTFRQDRALDVLKPRWAAGSEPLLVMGDFNISDRQPTYRELSRLLHDTQREVGWGFGYSFPSGARRLGLPVPPLIRIDYVFHNDAWAGKALHDDVMPGSDHRFVVADLVLKAATERAD